LGIVLKELRDSSQAGGVTLQHLVNVCGVSKRHIYRYLRELEEMGVPIERPQIIQPGKPGGGRYKLRDHQSGEAMGETMLIVALNQMLAWCCLYRHQMMFLKELIIYSMAVRYGFKLPLNFMTKNTAIKLSNLTYCEIESFLAP